MNFPTYTFNEGSLTIPENWQDQSMNVFVLPDDSGINLVINRAPVPVGMTKEEYMDQVILQFRQNLEQYKESSCTEVELSDEPAQLLDYNWKSPEGLMYQYTFLQIRNNFLLTFTYTSSQPFTKNQKESLLNIIYSFKASS